MAMASLMGAWDKVEAEREFLRALELNPGYTQASAWYALFYLMLSEGRPTEAVAEARRALQFDPLSSYVHLICGFVCGCAGEYSAAIQASRHAVELDSESYLPRWALQEVLRMSGKLEESVATGNVALTISGRHWWSMTSQALAFVDLGQPEHADAIYTELLARASRQFVPPAQLAIAAAAASRQSEAICHTREAFRIHDPHCHFSFSRHVPYSARLYAYPSFREVLLEVGFK
jgi:tetratricopeptide (TPR) repeat protein